MGSARNVNKVSGLHFLAHDKMANLQYEEGRRLTTSPHDHLLLHE